MRINGLGFGIALGLAIFGLNPSPIADATSFSSAESSSPQGLPPSAGAISGTWRPLTNAASFNAEVCVLLTDATVMCHKTNTPDWWRLTPDAFGGYANGTWSQAPSMDQDYAPFKYASAVLADGRLGIVGGAINLGVATYTNKGSIFDPRLNGWTALAAPIPIGNSPSAILPNGTFLVSEWDNTRVAVMDPVSLGWTAITPPSKLDNNQEEGWTLLPDGTVLTVDVTPGNAAEKYVPGTGWVAAGHTPVALVASCSGGSPATGPAVLQRNGTVFAAGATGHSAIYTPGAAPSDPGAWSAGPDFPNVGGKQLGVNDGPAALLPNGNVLIIASPVDCTPGSRLFEFDGATLTQVAAPPRAPANTSDSSSMLVLPTGEILLTDLSNDVEIYTPAGSSSAAWAPTITTAPGELQPGVTYQVAGTRFNGLSQGAGFGAENNTATNYPLVRITNRATGHVVYARTHDHSTMAVATGSAIVSTSFDVPGTIELGTSDLEVVANGIASAKWPINVSGSSCPGTLPSISAHPQSQTITAGGIASLHVIASGATPLSYQWYIGASGKTANPIAGATSSTYTTPASSVTTSYWVRVSNVCGSADSITASITIGGGTSPSVATQPQSQKIIAGYAASLNVVASGTPPLSYQWYIGASGNTANPIAGATSTDYATSSLITTTTYWVRVSNAFGIFNSDSATIRVVSRKDLVVDFGAAYGLWSRDGGTAAWTQLNTVSAKNIITADLDGNGIDEVIGDFGIYGIWIYYNNSNWIHLHGSTASHMTAADFDGDGRADLAVDFPGFGIWVWVNDTYWFQLHTLNSSAIVAGDLDGNGQQDAIIDFPGYGIWVWKNNSGWFQLHSFQADLMTVGDFDGNGLDDVVIDFTGHGLWEYANNSSWSPVHNLSATHLATGDLDASGRSDLIVDFGSTYGIWILRNNGAWSQLHTLTSMNIVTGDLDRNRQADIIINFGAAGLWEYANDAAWSEIHPFNAGAIAVGHISGP